MDKALVEKVAEQMVEGRLAELEAMKTPEFRAKEQEVIRAKKIANGMLMLEGLSPLYLDVLEEPVEKVVSNGNQLGHIRTGQFFSKKLATAVREYLEMGGSRENPNPRTPEEVLEALERGGWDFAAAGWKPELRYKNLVTTLGKNSTTFVRIPSGEIGLVEWYPDRPNKPKKRNDEESRNSGIAQENEEGQESSSAPVEELFDS